MSDTPRDPSRDPDAPRLGDTLGTGRAGRVDPRVGETQAGSPSHERASFADPITTASGPDVPSPDRVAGSAPTVPPLGDGGEGRNPIIDVTGATPNARPDEPAGTARSSAPNVQKRTAHEGQQAHTVEGLMDRMDDRDRLDAERAAEKGAKTNDIIHHDDHPGVGDHIGEAAGGISGVLTGAAIGSVGGPIGTIIGGIAGAVGGWWSGRAISEAATRFTHHDDEYYRTHYESSPNRLADRRYEDVRPAYQLGHLASHNPDYADREWADVERDLQRGWTDDLRAKHGDWASVRPYASHGFTRGRTALGSAAATTGAVAGAAGNRLADKVDDLKDRVDGNPASRPGVDATDSARRASGPDAGYGASSTGRTDLDDRARNAADRVGDKAENAWDRTKAGAENLGHRIADKADDLKDRVDGDPSTRPGPDGTDRRY